MWYVFDTLETFNTWHESLCISLGIPNETTLAYTEAIQVGDKWIAVVEEEYAEGLMPTDLRPIPIIVK